MKYCVNCGSQLNAGDKFCPYCGSIQQPNDQTNTIDDNIIHASSTTVESITKENNQNNSLITCTKVFLIIGTIIVSLSTYLIGILWTLPMTIHYFKKIKQGQKLSVAFKVCCLLFIGIVPGILMLVDEKH